MIEYVEKPLESVGGLEDFFRQKVEDVRGPIAPDDIPTQYVVQLLARPTNESVVVLGTQASFFDFFKAQAELPPQDLGEFGRQVGDGILGIYGFFPEMINEELRSKEPDALITLGIQGYNLARKYYNSLKFWRLSSDFLDYFQLVRDVRERVSYESSIDFEVEKITSGNIQLPFITK